MSTAVQKEAAWLATSGDGLPALSSASPMNGPFDVIQGYWPRTPQFRKAALYVTRTGFQDMRFGAHRKIRRHSMLVRILWPIGSTTTATTIWETEQAALDAAVDLAVARIVAFDMDKTHGGRFMSVAEAPEQQPIQVRFSDPARQTGAGGRVELTAEITYNADDNDYIA